MGREGIEGAQELIGTREESEKSLERRAERTLYLLVKKGRSWGFRESCFASASVEWELMFVCSSRRRQGGRVALGCGTEAAGGGDGIGYGRLGPWTRAGWCVRGDRRGEEGSKGSSCQHTGTFLSSAVLPCCLVPPTPLCRPPLPSSSPPSAALADPSSVHRRSSSPCASSAVPPFPPLPALSPTTPGAQRRRSRKRSTRSTTPRSRTCSRTDEWNRVHSEGDEGSRGCCGGAGWW